MYKSLVIFKATLLDVFNNKIISTHEKVISVIFQYGERFAWDTKVQGQVLGSYFYGFVLTGLPSGYLAER